MSGKPVQCTLLSSRQFKLKFMRVLPVRLVIAKRHVNIINFLVKALGSARMRTGIGSRGLCPNTLAEVLTQRQ